MSRKSARDRFKGSDLDTNQKQLTENDKRLYYTPTAEGELLQLTMINQNVVIDNAYGMTVALPSVAEVKNLSFTITVLQTGNAVTLTDYPNDSYNDSVDWGGDYTLDAEDDSITLMSTGSSWTVTNDAIAE
jgi:hypothetical protein